MSTSGKIAVACGAMFAALVAAMLEVRGLHAAPRPGSIPWLEAIGVPAFLVAAVGLACLHACLIKDVR
jgi:hypothetical protein